jgi:hypothetical protein
MYRPVARNGLRPERDELGAKTIGAGTLVPLEHSLVHECAEEAKGRRLVQSDVSRKIAHRPLGMLGVERLENRKRTTDSLRSWIRRHRDYRPIDLRYDRSHAAGMDSSGENGPGRYARDEMPS